MHQRLRRCHRVECKAARVTVAGNAARHGGVARVKLIEFCDARQTDRFWPAPAARTMGALERFYIIDPAFGVNVQPPNQARRWRRLCRRRRLPAQRGDGGERIAPDLAAAAEKRRGGDRAVRAVRLRTGRHGQIDPELAAGLLHQRGQPVAARREQIFEQPLRMRGAPAARAAAEPRGQYQPQRSVESIGKFLVDALVVMQGKRLLNLLLIAHAHCNRVRPAAPEFVR